MLDLLIRGGVVIDGSGSKTYPADVAISSGRIEYVGPLEGAQADRVIEAAGVTVVPGFIDSHVHADVMLLHDPQHAAGLCQGVTTEILGQDGLSYAPLSPLNLQLCRRYLAGLNGNPPILWDWSSVAEFRSRFNGTVAVNTAYLIPHNAVRLETTGWRDVPLRGDDLRSAQDIIRRGLDEGAVGFSTGLSYFPGAYSDTDEIVALCRPVAERDSPYVVHLRTVFRAQPFDPVEEALEIGRRSGVPQPLATAPRPGPGRGGGAGQRDRRRGAGDGRRSAAPTGHRAQAAGRACGRCGRGCGQSLRTGRP